MYYVYFLQSLKNSKYYVGVTSDVEARLSQHNKGESFFTAPHRPWKIVRVEEFSEASNAYKREKFIKSKKSRKIVEIIINSG